MDTGFSHRPIRHEDFSCGIWTFCEKPTFCTKRTQALPQRDWGDIPEKEGSELAESMETSEEEIIVHMLEGQILDGWSVIA